MSEKQKQGEKRKKINRVIHITGLIIAVIFARFTRPENLKAVAVTAGIVVVISAIASIIVKVRISRLGKELPQRKNYTRNAFFTQITLSFTASAFMPIVCIALMIKMRDIGLAGMLLLGLYHCYETASYGDTVYFLKWLERDPGATEIMYQNDLLVYNKMHGIEPDTETLKFFTEPEVIDSTIQFNQGLWRYAYLYRTGDYKAALMLTLRLIKEAPYGISTDMMNALKADTILLMSLTNEPPERIRACVLNLKPYLNETDKNEGINCGKYAALYAYTKLVEKNEAAAAEYRRKYYEAYEKSPIKEALKYEKALVDNIGSLS
jgi:hypothetical protein